MKDFFSFNSDAKIAITVREPEVEMSILRRLGKPKFWVSNNDFNLVMEKLYKAASKNAMAIFKSRNE
ncbi:MAG: hypothetical protein KJ955_04100 [Nanoarchaeota archaeon]|nr:hypothetical protein [Nanoarchaeota archaeon]